MSSETLIYIIIAGIIALLLALFQYRSKSKRVSKWNALFLFLRFLTVFSVLLLLINPKFEQLNVYIEKPNLVIAVDNSASVKHLGQDTKVLNIMNGIINNENINNKFNIDLYTFGDSLKASDSISFSEQQTNIANAFNQFSQIYKSTVSPVILISDGNQTYGQDYEFTSTQYEQPIYPIILGDTIRYTDLKIQQLNVNKYAYLKNRFPVEIILVYNGNANVNSRLVVSSGKTTVYSKPINFTKTLNSKIVNLTLPANRVGVSSYKASIIPIANEKNKVNNIKNFAVQVIDQKTNVAFISDFLHPDLGALKKSIESNEQRTLSFLKPHEYLNQINDFQLVILYNPNNKFGKVIKALDSQNKNRFTLIGQNTDLNFLNSAHQYYTHEITNQLENYQAEFNANYIPFKVEDIGFNSLPPLKSNYGAVTFSVPFETILSKKKGNVNTNTPLLATFETNGRREAVLFGEDIWQWRAQSFLNNKSFNEFDDFIGKLVQYLASNKRRNRLNVEYESFYKGNNGIVIKVQFFDKNYVFDSRETIIINVKNNISNEERTFPFILKNNHYQVDLNSLPPSEYSFKVIAKNENMSRSGNFQILEFNVEQQFLNANVTKLQQLASNSGGTSYFIDNYDPLMSNLLNDNRYVPIQKSNKNIIPLIDWKYLLILIALSLCTEWFLRKYNGLI